MASPNNKNQPKAEPAAKPPVPQEPKEPGSLEGDSLEAESATQDNSPGNLADPGKDASGQSDRPGGPPANEPKAKRSLLHKLTEAKFLYIWIFLIVIAGIGVLIFFTLKWSKAAPQAIKTTTASLSNAQLASLAQNTTVVGDAKQTLSVESNAIFQGQVLLKQGLDVAGTLKVGGGLSLPSITVGGNGSFGQLEVNDTLSVAGNSVVQGQLNVQKGLTVAGTASFGSISAAQLSVTNLQLNSDLLLSRHLVTSGGNPSKTNGTALGDGGTASVGGSDTAGTVNVNTGSGPIAVGCFINITFTQKYSGTPHIILSPSNSAAGNLNYYTDRSSTGFSVCTDSAPSASTTYLFDYFVAN